MQRIEGRHIVASCGNFLFPTGKSGLSNKPIFPKPPCLSQQQKHSKESEAHTSGACMLPSQTTERTFWGNGFGETTTNSYPNISCPQHSAERNGWRQPNMHSTMMVEVRQRLNG